MYARNCGAQLSKVMFSFTQFNDGEKDLPHYSIAVLHQPLVSLSPESDYFLPY